MKYDVAVIGAGPAGATAAKFLSQSGLKVVLIEKKNLPRDKPCGGALSLHHLKRFKYLGGKRRGLIGGCPSYGVKVYSPSLEAVAEYTYSEPQVLLVLRKEFDQVLVDLALDSGTELRNNTVKDVTVTPDAVKITVDGGQVIESELVVGADGANSVVGKKTGLNPAWEKWQVTICAVNEVQVGESVVEEFVGSQRPLHIFSFNDFFGYGWLFPKREHLNVGIGGPLSLTKDIYNMFVRLVRILKDKELIPRDFQNSGFKARFAPVSGIIRKPYGDRVVLCGDAAGCSNPLNGEGIYYAMASGQIASETIIRALENGDVNSKGLSGYRTDLMEDFGYDHEIALNLQRQAMITWPLMENAVGLARADEYLLMKAIDHGLGKISTSQFLLESGARFPISCMKYAMQGLSCKR